MDSRLIDGPTLGSRVACASFVSLRDLGDHLPVSVVMHVVGANCAGFTGFTAISKNGSQYQGSIWNLCIASGEVAMARIGTDDSMAEEKLLAMR